MYCNNKRAAEFFKLQYRIIQPLRMFRILTTISVIVVQMLILGFYSPPPVHAQEEDLPFNFNTINWAYAAAFGTGVYRVRDDVDVFVLSMQPSWTKEISWKRCFGDRPMLLELRFPITFGVHNYHVGGIVDEFLALKFRQVSFAPGAFLELPMSQRWALRPFAHLGWGTQTSGNKDSSWIYWGGIKSRLKFPFVGLDFGLLNGLTIYGFTPKDGASQDFSEILTGLECDIPLGKLQWQDEQLLLKTHIVNRYYLDNLNFLNEFKKPPDLSWQWEFGISLSKKKSKIKLWFFQFERIGIAYSYARDARGIRFYTRSTFKM
jgi:hypothetical protein